MENITRYYAPLAVFSSVLIVQISALPKSYGYMRLSFSIFEIPRWKNLVCCDYDMRTKLVWSQLERWTGDLVGNAARVGV